MTASSKAIEPANAAVSEEAGGLLIENDEAGRWSYRFAMLFLAIYFIRPQDWVPGMAGANIIRPIMLIWGLALMIEGFQSPLRGFFRTPHDWAMLIFYVYVVWNSPSEAGAGSGMFSLVVFYYLTTQALSSWGKLLKYLWLWNWLLVTLAVFGVLQTLGLDITGGKEITDYGRGRLALGTWTCNNANALGHTVVAAIPLSYMLLFWRGGVIKRFVIFPAVVAFIFTCALRTESKGSFLVGAALTVLIFVLGRPQWIQMIVLASALTAGVGALSFLPRMESMGSLRSEEGVQGRLMAWEKARGAIEQNTTGVGWRQFHGWVTVRDGNRWIVEDKSTHSSYVQVGADLGKPGLFLWLLVLWTGFRSVFFCKVQNDEQERCRRAVLLILTAYLLSSWMINREYYTEYYLIAAMAAAMHRLMVARSLQPEPEQQDGGDESSAARLALAGLNWAPYGSELGLWVNRGSGDFNQERRTSNLIWNRLDWKDLLMTFVATWGVLQVWDYVIQKL